VESGAKGLHVVSDFDRTLTLRRYSTHGTCEQSPLLPEKARLRAKELYERFYPVELDHSVPHAAKYAAMREWWLGANASLVDSGLCKQTLRRIVADALQQCCCGILRPGAKDLFALCHEHGVPLTIFSAGVADVLEEIVLQDAGYDLAAMPEAVVVANRALWREDGVIAGFAEPLVHAMNKCELPLPAAVRRQLRSPPRLLLLGDSLSDAHMADPMLAEMKGDPVVLRIAWIGGDDGKDADDAKIADFLREFDAVVTGDGPLTTALDVISGVVAAKH